MNTNKFKEEFISNANYRLDESLRMIEISLAKITEEQLWQKPNTNTNSIANLILHLCGNLRQYGISSLKEIEDIRNRDLEFSMEKGFTKKDIFSKLTSTVLEVKNVLKSISDERLVTVKPVQGFEFSGIGNIIHLVEHFSYHTGQIAFWVKFLKDEQLGFYDGQDLNILNNDKAN
ncbi:hypothetical protein GCM10011414_12820 [Croceivirga lutea]|uniref:DinB family protein n=1 Tax=Croceivirga lutea TaxID=1775167 RepID=UPI001639EF4D|nr:DinB family protein [Croceivirga lutea]GGG44681.1 hypothetical protein GCM10011414_12820 [Croceivirga lutea]